MRLRFPAAWSFRLAALASLLLVAVTLLACPSTFAGPSAGVITAAGGGPSVATPAAPSAPGGVPASPSASTAPAAESVSSPNCDPCTFKIAAGLPPYSFRFDLRAAGEDQRVVERVQVSREDRPGWTQALTVHDMSLVQQRDSFFIGTADINFDGYNDLLLATSRGVANTFADYWLFVPSREEFSYLGNYPMFRLDPATHCLSTYDRGGHGGMIYTTNRYCFVQSALTLVESEKQEPTRKPDTYRRTIYRLEAGKLRAVKTETVKAPPAN